MLGSKQCSIAKPRFLTKGMQHQNRFCDPSFSKRNTFGDIRNGKIINPKLLANNLQQRLHHFRMQTLLRLPKKESLYLILLLNTSKLCFKAGRLISKVVSNTLGIGAVFVCIDFNRIYDLHVLQFIFCDGLIIGSSTQRFIFVNFS